MVPKTSRMSLKIALSAAALTTAGCAGKPGGSRVRQGAGGSAATGAGIGLLLGIPSGKADLAARALAVDAVAGVVRWGYEGWRQDQRAECTRQIPQAVRESGAEQAALDANAHQRLNLTRFLGVW